MFLELEPIDHKKLEGIKMLHRSLDLIEADEDTPSQKVVILVRFIQFSLTSGRTFVIYILRVADAHRQIA